jgi:hypothetical protein
VAPPSTRKTAKTPTAAAATTTTTTTKKRAPSSSSSSGTNTHTTAGKPNPKPEPKEKDATRRNEKLRRFISHLLHQQLLSSEEAQVLSSLLDANHVVLGAAYRVAQLRRQDKELLTSLMRNIANIVLEESEGGREEKEEEGFYPSTLEVIENMLMWLDLFRHELPPSSSSSSSSSSSPSKIPRIHHPQLGKKSGFASCLY